MDDDFGLIPSPDPEARSGPFPLLDSDLFPISRTRIVDVLAQAPKLYNNGNGISGIRVSRITHDVVVKYGSEVKVHEARNMKFVLEHSSVPVPLVHNFWEEVHGSSPDDSPLVCYIVMQYIDGDLLSEIWTKSDNYLRQNVNEKLLKAVSELQLLIADSPGPVGGGISEGAFFTDYGAGPFESSAHIESWFNERLIVCQDFGIATHTTAFTGQFEHLVMCHMDLHLRNIILDRHGKLWLIDWAHAGFYPPYFEIAMIIRDGLEDSFKGLLDKMPMELWRKNIDRLFAIGFALTTGAFNKPRNQSNSTTTK